MAYALAKSKGQLDLKKIGAPVDIPKGKVVTVPDNFQFKPGSWLVPCDKDGNSLDPEDAKKVAKEKRARADALKRDVATAQANYELADKQAKDAEDRYAELSKPKGDDKAKDPNGNKPTK